MTAAIPTRRVKRGADPCQLCRVDWSGRAREQAVATVANHRLCARHLERLVDVASANGVMPAEYLRRGIEVTA